jgi:threonine/homoserine/homoserine lactone efflux protein
MMARRSHSASASSLGISLLAQALIDQRLWLRLIGGLFLLYLGVRTLRSSPASRAADVRASSLRLAGAYSSTLALTLSNPMTIMSFAGIGASGSDLVVGVFSGSAAWWLVLATLVSFRWINIGSGMLITTFGLQSLLSASG